MLLFLMFYNGGKIDKSQSAPELKDWVVQYVLLFQKREDLCIERRCYLKMVLHLERTFFYVGRVIKESFGGSTVSLRIDLFYEVHSE